jgi:hypothetical protein
MRTRSCSKADEKTPSLSRCPTIRLNGRPASRPCKQNAKPTFRERLKSRLKHSRPELQEGARRDRGRVPPAVAELRRVATAITGNREPGLDAVQDAFALAGHRRGQFRSEGSREGWLWRIVVHTAQSAAARLATSKAGGVAPRRWLARRRSHAGAGECREGSPSGDSSVKA